MVKSGINFGETFSANPNQTNVDIGAIAVSEDCSMVACEELGPVPLGLITVWNLQTQRLIYSFQWHPIKGSSNI